MSVCMFIEVADSKGPCNHLFNTFCILIYSIYHLAFTMAAMLYTMALVLVCGALYSESFPTSIDTRSLENYAESYKADKTVLSTLLYLISVTFYHLTW